MTFITPNKIKRIWICNKERSQVIDESLIDDYIDKGYQRGRTYLEIQFSPRDLKNQSILMQLCSMSL